ncbi:MAG: sulfatase [Prosthecobacter sp.]|uniref:sulfatase n=1 Tax=Prosthecobacter sp. TaxID=1965333 RepID=UPI002631B9AF|nr:sulfatase [Prosthecobacter sp.]MCF7789083.1 sulfatase [Prosthecobacter sp.]
MRTFFFFLLLCPALFAAQPNIVFILADDFGYGDLGCMGCKDIATPNIDRLAAEGVKFTDFYANAPVCTPTRAGFITGRWQQRCGIEFAFGYQVEQFRRVKDAWVPEPDIHGLGLPLGETTIAQRLKTANYATGAFGKWHLGYKDEYNPTKRGFDEYFGELLGHADYYKHTYYDGTYALRDGLEPVKREGYFTDLINDRAVKFIRDHKSAPFFMYVPHLAVHSPFEAPDAPETPMVTKESMLKGSRAIYKAMVERIDLGVGMILAELDTLKLAENTLVVFSSDNGGERYSRNSPLFHHKATVWEGGIRVPCLMRWPGKLPKGKVTSQMAITMDLHATFLAVAGVTAPAPKPLDGINLLPLITGDSKPVERTFFWRIDRSNRKQRAIRQGPWKYINDGNSMDLLFNLDSDIGERTDLGYQHPDILADLKAKLKAWEAEIDATEREIWVR